MKTNAALLFAVSLMILIFCSVGCDKSDDPWDISDWEELGGTNQSTFGSTIRTLAIAPDGNVYVAGYGAEIMEYNGSTWSELGNVSASPFTGGIHYPVATDLDGNVYAVGMIQVPLANSEYHVAKWVKETNSWINLTTAGNPMYDNGIHSIVTDGAGNVYVAGNSVFTSSSGSYIMKWDGFSWSIMGDTVPSGDNMILHLDATGILYACLGSINDNSSAFVAKWTGSGWLELGGENTADFGTGQILSLASDPDGNIYVGGHFVKPNEANHVMKWNAASGSWTGVKDIQTVSPVYALACDGSGNLYAGGWIVDEEGRCTVKKWDGTQWSFHGNLAANGYVYALAIDDEGNVYAAGDFTNESQNHYVALKKK